MFSIASCVGLFAFETLYILGFYDPSATKTQVGLMLIFALEESYLFKIAQSNLEEKKALGKISGTTRLYTAFVMIPLLGAVGIAAGLLPLNQYYGYGSRFFSLLPAGRSFGSGIERNRDWP
jgi:hypothetical protein